MLYISPKSAFAIGATFLITGTAFAQFPESFADLAEEVSPAVVRITTTQTVTTAPIGQIPNMDQLPDFFQDFFNQAPGLQPQDQERRGLGSGFIIEDGKFIITNNHVIDGADEIEVELVSGDVVAVELVGTDPSTDVAVLKVTSDVELPSVEFADSNTARVGDWVMAVGNPLGQDFTVTTGIVSARHRSLDGLYDDFIQTDAAINRGNSGGPLFNMEGEVVGVNTAILSPSGGSIGLGFSMSSNVVSKIVEQIIDHGEARRGYLGVEIGDLSEDMASAIGRKGTEGVFIQNVSLDGPADQAGIKAGDVILSFNGEKTEDAQELIRLVGDAEVGAKAKVEIYRPGDDKTLTVNVTLAQRPGERQIAQNDSQSPAQNGEEFLGMNVAPIDSTTAETLELQSGEGLIINDIAPDSEAAKRGLRPGDVILEVNQKPVSASEDFREAIEQAKKMNRDAVLLLIVRKGQANFIALPITE